MADDLESNWWQPYKMVLVLLSCVMGRQDHHKEKLWLFTILYDNRSTSDFTFGYPGSDMASGIAENAVEAEDSGLSTSADGIEENREADHNDKSSRMSLRSDSRGGWIERTAGRGRRRSLPLRTKACCSASVPACSLEFEVGARVGGTGRRRDGGRDSAFSWGSGRMASSSVMGGGDPLFTPSSG